MAIISDLRQLPIFNFSKSSQDARTIKIKLDFNTDTVWTANLQQERRLTIFETIRSIYFNAQNCANDVSFSCVETGQTIILEAGKYGYLPVLISMGMTFQVRGVSPDVVDINLLNVDMPPIIWPNASTSPGTIPISALDIVDAPSVVGGNVNGPAIEIHAGTNDRLLARTAGAIAFQQLTNGMVPANTVGLDKLVNATAQYNIMARVSAAAGAWEQKASSADVFSILGAASFAAVRALLSLGAAALLGVATDADARAQTSSAVLLTPANLAGRASFSANKGGANQAGCASAVFTQITFPTVNWNTGGLFASNAWTPNASKIRLGGIFNIGGPTTTLTTNGFGIVSIFKNGVRFADLAFVQFFAGQTGFSCAGSCDFDTNGTDVWTFYAYADLTAAGTYSVFGATTLTPGASGEQI